MAGSSSDQIDEIYPQSPTGSDSSTEEITPSGKEQTMSAPVKESENSEENQAREHDGYKFRPSKQAVLESFQSLCIGTVAITTNLAANIQLPEINPGIFGGIFAAGTDAALYGMERIVVNRSGAKLDIDQPISQSNYFTTFSGFAFDIFKFGLNIAASFGGDLAGRIVATLLYQNVYHEDLSSDEDKEIVDTFGAIGNTLAVVLVAMIAKRIHNNCTNRTRLESEEERPILMYE